MKRLFTILILLFGCYSVGLTQSSFTVSDTEVWTITEHTETDKEAHFSISSRVNNVQTIRWERTVIEITPGCNSQVCDLNQCYIPIVSTQIFELGPNASGDIIMHFLNYDSIVGAASVINLKMSNENDPTDSVVVTFLYTSSLSGTDDLPAADVKLFPNPTVDYFQLTNADAVNRIRVFSMDNREVVRFTTTPDQKYSLATQPAGTYILALEDDKGQIFQAIRLVKQ